MSHHSWLFEYGTHAIPYTWNSNAMHGHGMGAVGICSDNHLWEKKKDGSDVVTSVNYGVASFSSWSKSKLYAITNRDVMRFTGPHTTALNVIFSVTISMCCSVLFVNCKTVTPTITVTQRYLPFFVILSGVYKCKVRNYYQLPIGFSSKVQSSMTTFHHKLLTRKCIFLSQWMNASIIHDNICSLLIRNGIQKSTPFVPKWSSYFLNHFVLEWMSNFFMIY